MADIRSFDPPSGWRRPAGGAEIGGDGLFGAQDALFDPGGGIGSRVTTHPARILRRSGRMPAASARSARSKTFGAAAERRRSRRSSRRSPCRRVAVAEAQAIRNHAVGEIAGVAELDDGLAEALRLVEVDVLGDLPLVGRAHRVGQLDRAVAMRGTHPPTGTCGDDTPQMNLNCRVDPAAPAGKPGGRDHAGLHGFGEPQERAYTHAMEALGVEPHETSMVGDNLEWEIAAPQRLGIYAIWHDAYRIGIPPNCGVQPDRIIHSLPELLR
jgi:hypothetical protein